MLEERFSRRKRLDEKFILALKLNKYFSEPSYLLKERMNYLSDRTLKFDYESTIEVYNREYLQDLLDHH